MAVMNRPAYAIFLKCWTHGPNRRMPIAKEKSQTDGRSSMPYFRRFDPAMVFFIKVSLIPVLSKLTGVSSVRPFGDSFSSLVKNYIFMRF